MFNQKVNKKVGVCSPDLDHVFSLAKKLGVSLKQLNDAILETGSINGKVLQYHLRQKGILFSVYRMQSYMKMRFFSN